MTSHTQSINSPRLRRLTERLPSGDASPALERFWAEVTAEGLPLIEAVEGEDDRIWVTFLWREEGHAANHMLVISELTGHEINAFHMRRLAGTDLWYRTEQAAHDVRTVYRFAHDDSLAPLSEVHSFEEYINRTRDWQPDPHNPRQTMLPRREDTPPDHIQHASILEGPAAPEQSYVERRPGVTPGNLEEHIFSSEVLANERPLWVYTPPSYQPGATAYPLLLLFDGLTYAGHIPTPVILDNLISEGKIPPLVACFVGNAAGQRDKELACYPPFSDFIRKELLPWLRENYAIAVESEKLLVGGSSLGGLCAAYVALRQPGLFGKVLSQSGAFQYSPAGETEPGWLMRNYALTEALSLEFYLEIGRLEKVGQPGWGTTRLGANRHMRDVLRAKGYRVFYAEYNGGHDTICWQGTLADGLIALLGSSAGTVVSASANHRRRLAGQK